MLSLIHARAGSTDAMAAVFGDEALLRAALRFEANLAKAQADAGILDEAAAVEIIAACQTPPQLERLARAAGHAGTLAIPLVKELRARVAANAGPKVAALVHKGATSQDLADTALVLQAKSGVELIARDGRRLTDAIAHLTETHIETPMIGRTLLQGAMPITFGLKTAGWLLGVDAALLRLEAESARALQVQLGGPVGSLADMGGAGSAVSDRLAELLGLSPALAPWHTRREALAGLAAAIAILIGAIGKIARDISLMAQGEVNEAHEPITPGRGGSSAMAHKRNPTGCQVALSATARAPHLAATMLSVLPQAHERDLGGWQAEGPVLAELFQLAHAAITTMTPVLWGLDVQPQRMAQNLAAAGVGSGKGESVAIALRALAHHRKQR